MSDPNKPNSTYERIENTLNDLTVDPRDLAGSVYPAEDVESDIKQLEDLKQTPNYKEGDERSDAKVLEKTFTNMVELEDWFGEEESYGDDPESLSLATFPTSEIDDVFNHIDLIAMTKNEATNHEVLPFAVDLTYNTDPDKMSQKFSWKHVYGKTQAAPQGTSEFGDSHVEADEHGGEVLQTKALPLKFRQGLHIPGFASAKYFEDKERPWNPIHEKGRIELMPRLVVGYSPDLADQLAYGRPTSKYREKYGQNAYNQRMKDFEKAKQTAKWCTLSECSEQIADIRYMLDNLDSEKTEHMRAEELEAAKRQIAMLGDYFGRAASVAMEIADGDPEERAAMESAKKDPVRQAIITQSNLAYVGGPRRNKQDKQPRQFDQDDEATVGESASPERAA